MTADSKLPISDVAVSILEKMPEALVISNDQKMALWCNAAFEEIVGSRLDDIKNRSLDDILHARFSPVLDMKNVYCGIVESHNSQQWFEKKTLSLSNTDSKNNGTYSAQLFTNISEQVQLQIESRKLQEKLNELTTIEPVSGLLNNRAMLQSLEPLVSRSRRYNNPLSLIAINLLNLSVLVDRHGQAIADEAVIALSHLLRDQLRWADIVSRYSPSVVIIILPETSHEDALYLANKVMGQIDDLDIHDKNDTRLDLDACYAVASWQKGDDSSLLIARVHKFLETATKTGSHSIIDSD